VNPGRVCVRDGRGCVRKELVGVTVESTEGVSEIWFQKPFRRWSVLRFRVRVRFT